MFKVKSKVTIGFLVEKYSERSGEKEREKGREKRAHTYERGARRSVYSSESPRDKSRKGGIEDRGQYNVALPGIRALALLLLLLLLLLAVVAAAATNCSGRCARAGDLCDATAIYPPYKVACASELTQISAHMYILRQEDASAQRSSSCIAPISYFINYIMMRLYILRKLIVPARWSAALHSNDFDAAKWKVSHIISYVKFNHRRSSCKLSGSRRESNAEYEKRKSICIRVFAPEFIFQLCRAILDTVGIPTWYTRKKRKKDTQSRRQSQGLKTTVGILVHLILYLLHLFLLLLGWHLLIEACPLWRWRWHQCWWRWRWHWQFFIATQGLLLEYVLGLK
ncbi:unnamed protein product [Trichogramma brassicae]|uniref:Uncharacterized protein n=1 Tax=Trichogramma brassicae TaxID=86971 RepID=A0A6H5IRU9_9HYME|nr:unnamed protein product [Trichogramma brassicae]